MRHRLYKVRGTINRIWWTLGQFADVVHPVPLLGGFAILFLLSSSGQMHEIYLAHLERGATQGNLAHVVAAGSSLALLSAALYFSNYSLSNVQLDVMWAAHRDEDREFKLRLFRDGSGVVVAALPWIGLGLGLSESYAKVHARIETLKLTAASFPQPPDVSAIVTELERATSALTVTLLLIASAGALVVLGLHLRRYSAASRHLAFALIACLFLAAAFLPAAIGNTPTLYAVTVFRQIGPLAMIVLDVLVLFSFVTALTLLGRGSAFPIIALLVAIAVVSTYIGINLLATAGFVSLVFLAIGVLAALTWKWRLSTLCFIISFGASLLWNPLAHRPQKASEHQVDGLQASFNEWLKARKTDIDAYRAGTGRPYPVFIVAAEGGGIYAAAAAAAFLSRLQDACPNFAQHVFAISGVSGGSVGSTVFQSMTQGESFKDPLCAAGGNTVSGPLSRKTAQVIRSDHLSPLLGFIVADLLNTFDDRAKGLEQSLISSVEQASNSGAARAAFDSHWSADKAAPALVLNATSVESGYRVAFAPFNLDGLGGGSLYTFRSFSQQEVSLAGAAVVSARFPAVLPSFTTLYGNKHLNFVDGGYADSSGAFTALDLIGSLKSPPDVRLRLILLTSARAKFNISDLDDNTARDTLTPIITLLKVRGVFSEIAVARTIAAVDAGHADDLQKLVSPAQKGDDEWNAALVEIDEQSFALSLGWRISQTTQSIVSLLMGEPDLCTDLNRNKIEPPVGIQGKVDEVAVPPKEESVAVRTLLANSCVMHSIVHLLGRPDPPAN
jgi:hypothetical protein